MRFEWDSEKGKINLKKHKVSFEEAKHVFRDEMALEMYDEEHSISEDRYIIIGLILIPFKIMDCSPSLNAKARFCYSVGTPCFKLESV